MNKTSSIIISASLIVGVFILFLGGSALKNKAPEEQVKNVEVRDGVQYVTITARGGYFPRVSQATAGIPTKLVMKTKGTYDCSASLVVRAVGYQGILPQTGETEIDVGTPTAGEPLHGVCGMGMYSFKVEFS